MKVRILIIRLFVSVLLYGGVQYVAVAQKQQQPNCGTEISPEQAKALQQQVILALKQKMATNSLFTTLTYIPIRPHIIRTTSGVSSFGLASLNSVMAATNRHYMINGLGIQFYFAGETPHYINDDNLYSNFPYTNVTPLLSFDVSNALNQYYPYAIDNPNVGGYAYYPDNALYSTRSVIGTSGSLNFIGNHLIPHELGHNFSLIHTHGTTNGLRTNELVTRGAGANCASAGDQICDTPADPFLNYANEFQYSYDEDGCPQYSPNNTLRDANGNPYTPLVNNIMAYYQFLACPTEFTPGQYERIQAGLAIRQGHTAYTLDYPAANVAAPSNLMATVNGIWVQLSWQDNATNEMGYFIERSTSPSAGFVAVGGVAPDVTSFIDLSASPNTTYYYRIRPSNTITGSLSPNTTVTTPELPPVTGLNTTNIDGTSARLNWTSLGDGVEYDVQWRQTGTSTWTTIRHISGLSYLVSSLATTTSYEWQVKSTFSSTYSGPVTFTTICPVPAYMYNTPERMRALLSWAGASNQTYTLQWKQTGAPDWTTINNLAATSYTLTELNSVTVYEWRVQGICQSAVQSEFSNPQSFTTRACQLPYNTSLNGVGGDWASVSWFFSSQDPPRTIDLRYRPIGAPTWTTVNSLSSTYSTTGTYQIKGLTNNTTYEWQLRSVCSATEQTEYTTPNSFSFTTICRIPNSLTATTSATQANLGWRIMPSTPNDATFILQYRTLGSPDWTTVTSTTATFTGGFAKLTSLTNGTTYEWRVQTICSPTALSDFSSIAYFTTSCSVPLTNGLSASYITSTSVQLNWAVMDDPVNHYDVRYRPAGSPDWTTISVLGTNTTLNGLTNNTTYEWQLRTVCYQSESAPFTAGPSFTTFCRVPVYRTANPQVTSVTFNWEQAGPTTTYNIRYRKSNTFDWVNVNNLSGTTYLLPNLTGNTTYEWQIGTICSDGFTGYVPGVNFTTYSCTQPIPTLPTNISSNSAQLNWYFSYPSAETRYQLRYRVVGSTDWIMLDNLISPTSSASTIVTGLVSSATYEWQIRVLCSASESSAFTTSATFQTSVPCSLMYTIQSGLWNDPATWSCNRIPVSDDAVQIKHQVVLPASYVANARRINYDAGKAMNYGTESKLKIGF